MACPKRITATGAVLTGKGILDAIGLKAGSDTATIVLYDNTEASGTILWELSAVANTSSGLSILNITYKVGIFATLTGTSASCMIALK